MTTPSPDTRPIPEDMSQLVIPPVPAQEVSRTAKLPVTQQYGKYDMGDLMCCVVAEGASDLHCVTGYPPMIRLHGRLIKVEGPMLSKDGVELLAKAIMGEEDQKKLKEHGETDFAIRHEPPAGQKGARFRVNIAMEQGKYSISMRCIPDKTFELDKLGIPMLAIEHFLGLQRGLVLVVGPTGSGKSTTLASMLNHINETRDDKRIVTLEAPIEFEHHRNKKSVITQREVEIDTKSFERGVRAAMRQDPDIILVGEMRDFETMDAAITAAETGHLVFGTLHTTGAAKTVDRMILAFPAERQAQVRIQLSSVLQGVISQLLVPKINAEGIVIGRRPIFEVMVMNAAISNCIRENKNNQIFSAIQTGSKEGMVSMDDSLLQAYWGREISRETLLEKCYDNKTVMQRVTDAEQAAMR